MTDQSVRRDPDLSAVEIAKLEGRMDKGFAELNGRLDTMISEARAEREARRASAEAQQKQLDDHEDRLRAVEDRKTIAPWQLWLVASSCLGLVIAGWAATH
jgi:hypothetical protein